MQDPKRITQALLDVLELLVEATREGCELHGWALMKSTHRSGPTVYGVLDRLEDAGWITGSFEQHNPEPGRPPRRFYRLTGEGATRAERLLASRRSRVPGTVRRVGLAQIVLRAVFLGGAQ